MSTKYEPTQADLDAFIRRSGFTYGWENLESWARCMAEQACIELRERENSGSLLTGTTWEGLPYGFTGTKESVEAVSDALLELENIKRERESAKAGIMDSIDYVPGEVDRTAPERIWLQIDTDASNNDREEPWPGCDDVTWQDESVGGLEIQYVRADLAIPIPASARVPDDYESSQREVMESAARWWKHANNNGVTGAVKWLRDNETGATVIYTRGEYEDRLIAAVCSLEAAPKRGEG